MVAFPNVSPAGFPRRGRELAYWPRGRAGRGARGSRGLLARRGRAQDGVAAAGQGPPLRREGSQAATQDKLAGRATATVLVLRRRDGDRDGGPSRGGQLLQCVPKRGDSTALASRRGGPAEPRLTPRQSARAGPARRWRSLAAPRRSPPAGKDLTLGGGGPGPREEGNFWKRSGNGRKVFGNCSPFPRHVGESPSPSQPTAASHLSCLFSRYGSHPITPPKDSPRVTSSMHSAPTDDARVRL